MGDSEKAAGFFDGFAEIFDTLYEGKRSRWMQFIDRTFRSDIYLRFERTFRLFGDLQGKTVLDIGCGSGVYAMECLRRGAAHVTALDPAQGMLDLLRERRARPAWRTAARRSWGPFPKQDWKRPTMQ